MHKGWFGFCPVYVEDAHGKCPEVIPRSIWLWPLLQLNIWLQEVRIATCTLMFPEWEPTWKIHITGKRP
jgi:hypothetical protein